MKDDSLILKVHGLAAGDFLREQLTTDMDALGRGQWTHAVYCTADNAVLAYLWVFPWADGILLRLPRSAAPAFLAHIEPRIAGRNVHFSATNLCFGAITDGKPQPEPILYTAGGSIVLIGGVCGITPYIGEYHVAKTLSAEAWYAARIRAGIPEIYADTAELFPAAILGFPKIGNSDIAAQHRHLAVTTIRTFATGCRALYHKHNPAGVILDYGWDKEGCIIQAVVEKRYLGKPLHTWDNALPLTFRIVTEK